MSTLKTHNLQSPDAGSVNIAMTQNAGMVVAGLSTYSNQINVGSNIKLGNAGVITATSFVGAFQNSGDFTIDDYVVHAGDTNTKFGFPAADTISAETAGSERLRINSSGRVLIGTTSADSVGSIDQNVVIGSTTNAEEVALTLNVMEGTNNRRVKFFLDDNDGVFGLDSTASTGVSPFVVRMATSEKLRITSGGHVNIGGLYTQTSYGLSVRGGAVDQSAQFSNTKTGNGDIHYIGITLSSGSTGQALFGHTGHTTAGSQAAWMGNSGDDVAGGVGVKVFRGGSVIKKGQPALWQVLVLTQHLLVTI